MKRAAILGPALLLSACGFHPLYGGMNGQMAATLSTIYVEPMPDKIGYELRNKMIDLLDGPGTASLPSRHCAAGAHEPLRRGQSPNPGNL